MTGFLARLGAAIASTWHPTGSNSYVVRGFRVLVENSRRDISTSVVLRRLDDALDLIERHQPWRYAHLARDVRQFWIVRYPCRGAYFPETRTCLTELTFLSRTDITAAPVASSILHEGVHARVRLMTRRPESIDPSREERLCRRAELAFGRSLPTELGAPVVQRAVASLALSDGEVAPEIDWTEARRRQELIDAGALQRPRLE